MTEGKTHRSSTARRRQDRWIAGLNQIKEQLLVPGDINNKIKLVTDGVVEHFEADFCRIWIIDEGDRCDLGCVHAEVTEGPRVCRYRDQCLHLVASSGCYVHLDGELHSRVPFGSYKIGRVASGEDGKFITNNAAMDPGVHDHEWARSLGLESFAGYRISSSEGKVLGVLALFSQHRILPGEDSLLESLANTVSQVIQTEEIQQNLRESEARFRTLFENASDAIHVTNEEDVILEVNDRMCRLMGYTREELLSMTVADLQAPEVRAEPGNIVNDEVAQFQGSVFESLNIHKDGTIFPVEISVSKVESASGNSFYCNLRDISSRKQTEKEILEWQNRYQSAVQASGHVLYDWDSITNQVTYGGALQQMLGYSFDEMKGGLDRWIELIHPDDADHFNHVIEQLIATRQKAQLEYRVRTKAGTYIHVEDTGNFIGDEQTRMVGFVKDISERIRAKQLLQEEEVRYRTLFTESPIVLWEEDFSEVKIYIDELRSQGVKDWNKYFQENSASLEECISRIKVLNINMAAIDFYEAASLEDFYSGIDRLFTEESVDVFREELAAFAEGHTNFESEVQTVTFTGKPLYALVRVTIPKGYEDTWGKVFVSALDISERIEAEEILKRRTDEMATLHAITLDLTTPVELNPILESIVARATELLDGISGLLSLCDAETREVRCVVSYKTAKDFSGIVVNYGEGAAGVVAELGVPLIIDDYQNWDGRLPRLESEDSFQAILLVPIVWQKEILGVLVIQRNTEDRKFNQEDVDLLMILANHAAIAMENARLLQQVQRHADELEVRVLERTGELRTMVNAMAGREVRMAELKKVIKKLRRQLESSGMIPIADDPLNLEL